MPVPRLTDGVVVLRAHSLDDVDDVVATASDVDSIRYTTVPVPYGRDDAVRFITETVPQGWAKGTLAGWAIEADGRFAGNVDIRRAGVPEIGFVLAPWARGRGIMSRAVRLATRWAFDEAGLPVVHWSAHVGNTASWRVAEACGFTFDGTRPLSVLHRGELRDAWWASLRP